MADDCCGPRDDCCSPPPEPRGKPASVLAKPIDACCAPGVPVFDGMDLRYRRILRTVIVVNAGMFLTEMAAGQFAGSRALKADALDFLADTVTYGLSLAVIGASVRRRATAALFKGLSLSVMALWVFGSTIYQTLVLGVPHAEVMGAIGGLALAANLGTVLLLLPYKDGDANVSSVSLCPAMTPSAT